MLRRFGVFVSCFLVVITLTACGPSSKEDMLAKAKDGKVVFVLVGDTVTIEAAGGQEKKD